VRLFEVRPFILPTPSAVLASCWEFLGAIRMHAWQTFWTTMVGFALALDPYLDRLESAGIGAGGTMKI
jgi:NitT/TauT family transport system permease protein